MTQQDNGRDPDAENDEDARDYVPREMQGPPGPGEQRLALAVLATAVQDLVDPRTGRADEKARGGAIVHGEAWSFLTAEFGEWKRSREYWAEAAGFDADWLADRARRLGPADGPET